MYYKNKHLVLSILFGASIQLSEDYILMLNIIKKFFEQKLSPNEPGDTDHQLKLATAALFIEMMQQDHRVLEEERQAVKESLRKKFDLSDSETNELFKLAEQEANDAVDYFQFTSLIARQYTQQQKTKIIEYLWGIAYADSHLDPHEEHMVRRIADLIYVPHKDLIRTKHKIENKING